MTPENFFYWMQGHFKHKTSQADLELIYQQIAKVEEYLQQQDERNN